MLNILNLGNWHYLFRHRRPWRPGLECGCTWVGG